MFVKIRSGAVLGVNGYIVDVEVDVANGLPGFDVVGLPDSAVKESRERVRAAIRNTGYSFPVKRITVNLAPADTRKSGPAFDLPVAVGLLICAGAIETRAAEAAFFAGELSLDGAVRPITGVLPMLLSAREAGLSTCYVPAENAQEAALVAGLTVIPVAHLKDLVDALSGGEAIQPATHDVVRAFQAETAENNCYDVDFADVAGQAHIKRAMEIAAAGCHNLLMIGPPGAGKTMLARRMPTILPDLSFDESIEITKVYSIAGLLGLRNLMAERPFRTPHHTASYISLTGGGRSPMPGEISLAHNGVLFLDELPEFQKKALETLRQPLEDGKITLNRVGGVCTYPSAFLLLAAMNPCPCGYHGSEKCKCTDAEIARYLDKISGPLLDRIDIMVEATPVSYGELSAGQTGGNAPAEASVFIKARVEEARARQAQRFADTPTHFNAKMSASLVKQHCKLCKEGSELLKQIFESMNLSARAYHKILKVARTIADLEGMENIQITHIAEAVSYRGLDRKYW
ncbi:MAG: YifB family Mg chelatase-like AAA ATPase [Defluviitaleaceae bacterium]|nr:YifB family Mg chelatase-like AAA ATPase [Defluviitaleaceae bacterium]MCL2275002.1 YifB family Mg chelatase-like AAA ATPase [Defluviitaleaceae bacterium]